MDVRYWVKSDKKNHTQFVTNRVSEIRASTQGAQWRHIPGNLNPADKNSRGMKADELLGSNWLSGPEFLSRRPEEWPVDNFEVSHSMNSQEPVRTFTVEENDGLKKKKGLFAIFQVERFSNWKRLVRATAWMFRFLHNLKNSCEKAKGKNNEENLNLTKSRRPKINGSWRYRKTLTTAKFRSFAKELGFRLQAQLLH